MVLRRASIFLLIVPFFGLNFEYRTNLFSQIHEIIFHGNGGYDWHTVYNMPIWLRNFTYKKLEEYYKKQEEANNKANNQLKNTKEIQRPNINPSNVYNTSMPTKK
jgi:hypothetical protein